MPNDDRASNSENVAPPPPVAGAKEPPATGNAPLPSLRRPGYWIAGVFTLLLVGLIARTQYYIALESNAMACTGRIATQDAGKKLVFPDAIAGSAQVVHLHGRLCVALNLQNYFGAAAPKDPQETVFTLFIDGKNTGISTTGIRRPDSNGWLWLNWKMAPPDASDAKQSDLWKSIIERPNPLDGSQAVSIGVAEAGAVAPREIVPAPAVLDLYDPKAVAAGAALLALLGATIFYLNKDTGLFRDGTGQAAEAGKLATYSLAKTQTGLWTLLTVGGFLFIWIITGRSSGVITTDIVGLMGLQLGTGLAAVYIDKDAPPPRASKGFIQDILSSDGISPALQRIQMFAWTLVLACVFLSSLFTRLSFPSIDPSLLVLLGFVNGNYLGFKFPEKTA